MKYGRKGALRKKSGIIYGEKQLGIVKEAMSDRNAWQCKAPDTKLIRSPGS